MRGFSRNSSFPQSVETNLGTVTAPLEILRRWADYFENLGEEGKGAPDGSCEYDEEFYAEIEQRVRKNGKAPGYDGIRSECLRSAVRLLADTVFSI
jgi:hypothetical protein